MRIKHVIGIAFTCMVFIFSCQAQSSTESHAGKNKQEQKISKVPPLDQSGISLESGEL